MSSKPETPSKPERLYPRLSERRVRFWTMCGSI
jgi:hypothetical protein